mmetsp:Transcript_17426/g.48130  ORF Transcript_17426/g.48130 Transcript_17426/m.48130 type:complete len:354 (+) Transcript_17426:239-1300(+)
MGTPSKILQRVTLSAFLLFSGKRAHSFSSGNQFHGSNSIVHTANHSKTPRSTSTSTNTCLNMAATSESSPAQTMEAAKSSIARAISIGAPAYNAGDVAGCARVYRDTAVEIASLLPENLRAGLEETIRQHPSSREESDNENQNDANEAAWAFRQRFDSILDYRIPFVPSRAEAATTLEAFSDSMIPAEPYVINDNVMGGVSKGRWDSSSRTFRGTTSLANNGGFSSLRWRFDRIQNWSYAKGIYLKNVGHSKPGEHTFRLMVKDTTCEQVRGANFKTVFANPGNDKDNDNDNDDADTIFVPFESFDQMEQMGRVLGSAPAFNRGAVTELGLMAIKPTVVGDFELTIGEWGLYS